jgi:Ca2+-binding RTX toxin-like protein
VSGFENIVGSRIDRNVGSTQDTLTGNNRDNIILGLEGNDTLNGSGGNDYLDGGPGFDTIRGGAGNDTVYPGEFSDDIDRIWGDAGADTFLFKEARDYELLSSVTIRDFNFAEGDRIDLSQIDARTDIPGDQAFGWGGQGGSPGSGFLNYVNSSGPDGPHITLYANNDADGTAEMGLALDTVSGTPDPSWFIL